MPLRRQRAGGQGAQDIGDLRAHPAGDGGEEAKARILAHVGRVDVRPQLANAV